MSAHRSFYEYNTKEAPLVSIVIPVYNVKPYLAQCLESVIHQSYHNIEIIIIDDGSTDGSGLLCDQYAKGDDRIHVIHTENRGLASARNNGLEKCRGSYLMFADSDDWIEAHTVSTLIEAAKKDHADIVTAEIAHEYVGKAQYPKRGGDARIIHGDEILDFYGNGRISNLVWNKLYRAECFSDIRFPDGHTYEDVAVTWRIMTRLAKMNGTAVVLPAVLFHYRMRKSGITHIKSYSNILDAWTAFHEVYESLPEYQQKRLPSCFFTIGQMWTHYYGFSKKEKDAASGLVREMCGFSKKHFHQVMGGTYPIKIKAVCLISQSRAPFLMWFCFWCGKLRQIIRNDRVKLYP